jgi:hypothetical protein
VQGAVETFDLVGKLVGTAAPHVARSLSYVTISSNPPKPNEQTHDILTVLAVASQINNKINSLLALESSGQTLTPAQSSYLTKVAVVELAIVPTETNVPLLLPPQMPPPNVVVTTGTPSPSSGNPIVPNPVTPPQGDPTSPINNGKGSNGSPTNFSPAATTPF